MIKKISALFLALVLCISMMVVPASAAVEIGDAQIAFSLEWDKANYNAGETAYLSIYMDAADDLSLYTGSLVIGLNSSVFTQDDNPNADIRANATVSETFNSYWKDMSANVAWLAATIATKVTTANTADEQALYDHYIKITAARNSGGSHENVANTKAGFGGDEFDPTEPIITLALVVSADVADGTAVNAAITTGTLTCSPVQTTWKYYTDAGNSTKTANIAATDIDVTQATATATFGEPVAHECTPAEAVKENEVAATCGTDGSYESVVYCSECGSELSRETVVVPATGEHVYAKEIERVEPTCTEDGYVVKACGCSNDVNERTVLPATGHSYKSVVTKPTCTEVGYTTYTCSVCSDSYTGDEVPAKGHSYREKVTAPTCTEAGYTTYTCPFCKDTYTGNEVEATGHNYESVVTAPTCTTAGYTTYTCTVCGDSYTADEVEAIGHNYESEVTRQPACMRPGVLKYTCANCGDNYKEDIPATNHKNADGTSALVEIPAVPATCKTPGYTAGEKCTLCNTQTIVPELVPTSDHTWDEGVVTAPTYTSEGYTTYTCTVCSDTKTDDFVPALTPDTPDTPDQPDTPDTPETGSVFAIKEPAVKKLRFMDEMLLHTVMPADAPEGSYVTWEATEGAEFFTIMEDNGDGKLRITPKEEGWTTFKATLHDANGNVLATDEIEMFSRAHLFDKIGGIIRYIFGSNIKYER